jgi:formylglycine-generating enzyme required for sulfatase activity
MVSQVTNQQYLDFLKANPEWRKSKVQRVYADESYLQDFEEDLTLKSGVKPNSPVTFISWFAARAFCRANQMRLPTLEEWEYMGLASETKKNAYKDQEFLDRILEWYGRPKSTNAIGVTRSVYKNAYGVYDLHGLVWEWISDFNSSFVSGESRSDTSFNRDLFCGAGSLSGGNKENYAAFMRFGFRSSLKKGSYTVWNLGFRCVR